MAHELNFTNGKADMLSVRLTPWHSEGTVLPDHPSYADAIKIAGLNYTVDKEQTYRQVPGKTELVKSGAYVTVRRDTQSELGVVQSTYSVVQNEQAFKVLIPLIDEGIANIETAGVLRKGADAWMLVNLDTGRLPSSVREAFTGHEDKIKPYILVSTNHSGRRGILVALTSVRVVCANTLGAAEGSGVDNQIRVVHTDSAEQKLIEAAEMLWGNIIERYTVIAEAYEDMRSSYLIPEDFKRLVVDVVAENPEEAPNWNPDAYMAEAVISRYEAKKYCLNKLFLEGAGHTGEPTAWYGYNAAVEALDHNTQLWPTRTGVYRTASLLDGNLRQKKDKVFKNLLQFARS